MDKPYQAPQGRLWSTAVIFIISVLVLYTLFLLFQQFSLNRSVSSIEEEIVEVENKIEVLHDQQIEEIYVAQQLQDKVNGGAIQWSKIIKKLQDITPVTVFFSSYSGASSGELQLSGLGDSYGSVSDILQALDLSSDFNDAFVPSVTAGSTGDGSEVVSFSLTVDANTE